MAILQGALRQSGFYGKMGAASSAAPAIRIDE